MLNFIRKSFGKKEISELDMTHLDKLKNLSDELSSAQNTSIEQICDKIESMQSFKKPFKIIPAAPLISFNKFDKLSPLQKYKSYISIFECMVESDITNTKATYINAKNNSNEKIILDAARLLETLDELLKKISSFKEKLKYLKKENKKNV